MIIGITGNSGSGKTTLSKLLKKEYSAEIIDADEVVSELSKPGQIYFEEIVKKFGNDILLPNGQIDKVKFAKAIFTDNEKRKNINILTFKYVVEAIKKRANLSSCNTVIIDAPLLIESKLNEICDITISVIADEGTKIKRICARDSINENTAIERINSQPKDKFYLQNTNIVVINNEDSNLEKQIVNIKELIENERNKKICINHGKS